MRAKSEYWTMRLCLEETAWLDLLAKIRQAKPTERLKLLKDVELTVEEIDKIRIRANLNGNGASARTSVTAKCKDVRYSNMVENTSWR